MYLPIVGQTTRPDRAPLTPLPLANHRMLACLLARSPPNNLMSANYMHQNESPRNRELKYIIICIDYQSNTTHKHKHIHANRSLSPQPSRRSPSLLGSALLCFALLLFFAEKNSLLFFRSLFLSLSSLVDGCCCFVSNQLNMLFCKHIK